MKNKIRSYLIGLSLLSLGGPLLPGCGTWDLPARKTQRICVNPSGSLDAAIQQKSVNFSISSSAGTIDQVSWEFGNGSTTSTTGLTTAYTYPASGTYQVKAVLSNTCDENTKTTLLRTITVSDVVVPAVTLEAITTVFNTSAVAGMTVSSAGNATITRYGICYSATNPTPQEGTDPKVERTGTIAVNTPVSLTLTNLQPNTFYYARSYAVNQTGTGYSSPAQTFRTGQSPSVSLTGVPSPGITTAIVNFVVSSPGSPAAVSYGICYSATTNAPDIGSSVVEVLNPTVAASTAVNLTNLTPNKLYYYRPYAKLPTGEIIYGGVGSFMTQVDAVAQDLIALVSFTDGSLFDLSGSGNHAILVNNPAFTTDRKGRSNSAILLNGTSSYFYMAENASLRPDALSISIWIKPNAVTRRMQIYNKSNFADSQSEMYSSSIKPSDTGSGVTLVTDVKQNSNCQPGIGWQTFPLSSNLPLTTWHHVVLTYAGRSARMYYDGTLLYSNDNLPAATLDKCPGGDLRFGVQIRDYPQFFEGAMDDIRMYKRAITAAEVQTLFNQ